MISVLETLHLTGYTYNDIKPDNIMINFNKDGNICATLINYGLTSKYKSNKKHIEKGEVENLRGNLVFSTLS